ncbi:MAG TPA: L-fucose/L-arabinose isomerase family protein [Rhodothermales bacterium]|nr:L-fucose/L-arabinose isomerase family protein [Rhodothermales bacterium]
MFAPIKPARRPRIGLYSIGHEHYWTQFEGLLDRLLSYNAFIERRLSAWGDVINAGMVDAEAKSRAAAALFRGGDVDLIFCHAATYAMSASHIAIARDTGKPVVVLSLQPTTAMNYDRTTTGEWLAHCVACCVPEIANAFNRTGTAFHVVSGLLGLDETPKISVTDEATARHPEAVAAWTEIEQWSRAAGVVRTLREGRMGFLGHTYPGMLDMYSDFTMISAQTGMHVEILEMDDLAVIAEHVTDAEIAAKREQVEAMFVISEDSPSDPLARKPRPEQVEAACRVAVAQETMVREFDLDALTYYYRGKPGNPFEKLQEAFILGHSLLTAQGVPCSGEGDVKTAVAMKISDVLGVGGSYSEIVAADYERGTLLLGHDGPFHVAIAAEKPVLRGMGAYHGKWGTGVSVEATVRKGPVTLLNVTQRSDGRLGAIVNHGEAVDAPILRIGNTMTHVRFGKGPTAFMNEWFALAPTHHAAMSVGHNGPQFRKVATLLGWPSDAVCL